MPQKPVRKLPILKPKPKQVLPNDNSDIEAVLRSSGWLKILAHIEDQHPLNRGLGPAATMEQRAFHQIGTEKYQQILLWLKSFHVEQKLSNLPSEYAPETTKTK